MLCLSYMRKIRENFIGFFDIYKHCALEMSLSPKYGCSDDIQVVMCVVCYFVGFLRRQIGLCVDFRFLSLSLSLVCLAA